MTMLVGLSCSLATGARTYDCVIAKLNEEVILASDLADVLRERQGLAHVSDPVAAADMHAVKILLDRKLLLNVARRSNVEVPEAEIQEQVEAMVAEARARYPSSAEFTRDVAEEYGSLEKFKLELARRAKDDYRIARAVASRFTITDAEVAKFEQECRNDGMRPESFRLRRIGVAIDSETSRGGEKALARVAALLRAGTQARLSFAETAKRYSEIPGEAAMGGDLGYISAEKLAPEVLKAVEKLEPGQVTPPLVTGHYACIFYVEAKRGARSALYEKRFLETRDALLGESRRKASLILFDQRLASKVPAEYKDSLRQSVLGSTKSAAPPTSTSAPTTVPGEKHRRSLFRIFSH
jgi:parvulin-like peptidyl-prolyl isomerase